MSGTEMIKGKGFWTHQLNIQYAAANSKLMFTAQLLLEATMVTRLIVVKARGYESLLIPRKIIFVDGSRKAFSQMQMTLFVQVAVSITATETLNFSF